MTRWIMTRGGTAFHAAINEQPPADRSAAEATLCGRLLVGVADYERTEDVPRPDVRCGHCRWLLAKATP